MPFVITDEWSSIFSFFGAANRYSLYITCLLLSGKKRSEPERVSTVFDTFWLLGDKYAVIFKPKVNVDFLCYYDLPTWLDLHSVMTLCHLIYICKAIQFRHYHTYTNNRGELLCLVNGG